jgi:DNA-binding transcriptional regulator GbsR (MarR family)
MENTRTISADISDVMNDIAEYMDQTQRGIMIDMSSLPDKLIQLQSRVQNAPKEERQELTESMEQVMQSLNTLSNEIQQRYDALNRDINSLENSTVKE